MKLIIKRTLLPFGITILLILFSSSFYLPMINPYWWILIFFNMLFVFFIFGNMDLVFAKLDKLKEWYNEV